MNNVAFTVTNLRENKRVARVGAVMAGGNSTFEFACPCQAIVGFIFLATIAAGGQRDSLPLAEEPKNIEVSFIIGSPQSNPSSYCDENGAFS